MHLFFLHGNEPGVKLLLERLLIPHGSLYPAGLACDAVLCWGGSHRDKLRKAASVRLLNRPEAVEGASQARLRERTLRLHGIKTMERLPGGRPRGSLGSEFSREYRVPVFQLDALALFEKKHEGALLTAKTRLSNAGSHYQELDSSELTFHAKRASREAVKAVYALGLDYALVHVGIRPNGDTVVADVRPTFPMTIRYAELFADAITAYGEQLTRELERKSPAVLGADPEFVLQNPEGRIVPASRFFEKDGQVGSDGVVMRSHKVVQALAELRPAPSSNPRELVRRLKQTMRTAASMLGDEPLVWLAGGMPVKGLALGGHIHFSGLWPNVHLLRALDNYLALPLSLIEGEGAKRRRPRYGVLGDFRKKPHGGFEYRTLPSWLVSPETAVGVITLARIISDHYLKFGYEPLSMPGIQQAYYEGDKLAILPHAERLWKDIESTPAYKAYRTELDWLKMRMLELHCWDEAEDFRPKWGVQTEEEAPVWTPAEGNKQLRSAAKRAYEKPNVWLAGR
ncbi:putative amidoligase domain-containing protein [Paenibacillus sp. MBLB4367]|uniref:putative amidoligase domain-containing protein n=1 Tax=Paenibacillus sp. MBLB4367 TaxID=3384767 RepID=UPI0039081F8F